MIRALVKFKSSLVKFKSHLVKFESTQLVTLLITLGIAISGFISMDLLSPSFPALETAFSTTVGAVQSTITYYLIGFACSQLFYGPFSDYYGRRKILIFGFSIYLAGSFLCLLANSINMFLIARLVQGLGIGAGAALGRVILRDLYVGEKLAQVTGYFVIGMTAAALLSPVLGGVVQEYIGYMGNLWLTLGFGILLLVLIIFFLPETNQNIIKTRIDPTKLIQGYIAIFKNRIFLANVFCAGAALATLLAYVTISPFLFQVTYGVSPSFYGLICISVSLGELVGNIINIRLLPYLRSETLTKGGFVIILLSGLALICVKNSYPHSLTMIISLCFLASLGTAVILPNASATAFSSFDSNIGFVGAFYGFSQHVITMSTLFVISSIGIQSQFGFGCILIVLAIASLLIYRLIYSMSPDQIIQAVED